MTFRTTSQGEEPQRQKAFCDFLWLTENWRAALAKVLFSCYRLNEKSCALGRMRAYNPVYLNILGIKAYEFRRIRYCSRLTNMKEVYFDTEIYAQICSRQSGIKDSDVAKLVRSVQSDKVRVYLSGAVLDETVSDPNTSEQEVLRRLRLIRRIAKRKIILKESTAIIDDTISTYAKHGRVPSFFMSPPPYFKPVLSSQTRETSQQLEALATESQRRIKERKASTQQLFKALASMPESNGNENSEQSRTALNAIVNHVGVRSDCDDKCLDKLLQIRAMRAITASLLSQNNANPDAGESRSDLRHHLLCGSAIGTLVTPDPSLFIGSEGLSIDGLEIIELPTLLAALPS